MLRRVNVLTQVALILALFVSFVAVGDVQAGCLAEQDTCANCARGAMWEAMKKLDLHGIRRANLDLLDCSIDLYHCVILGGHHDYPCAV